MIVDEEVYLQHYGKKGMRWGQRRTARVQRHLDAVSRVAERTASKKDRLRVGLLTTQKGATKGLARSAKFQSKINDGKLKSVEILLKAQGIRIKDLNYHQN